MANKIKPLHRSWANKPIGELPIPYAFLRTACDEGVIRLLHRMNILTDEEADPEKEGAVEHALNLMDELIEHGSCFPLIAVVDMDKHADLLHSEVRCRKPLAVQDLSWLFAQFEVQEYLYNVRGQLGGVLQVYLRGWHRHLDNDFERMLKENVDSKKKSPNSPLPHSAELLWEANRQASSMYWGLRMGSRAIRQPWHMTWYRTLRKVPMLNDTGRKRLWAELMTVMLAADSAAAKLMLSEMEPCDKLFLWEKNMETRDVMDK